MVEFEQIGNFKLSTITDSDSLHFILLAVYPKKELKSFIENGEAIDLVVPLGTQKFMLRQCKFIKGSGSEDLVLKIEGTTEGVYELAENEPEEETTEEFNPTKPGFYYDGVNYGKVAYLDYSPDIYVTNVEGEPTLQLQKTVTGALVLHCDVFEFPFNNGVKFNNIVIRTEDETVKFKSMVMKTPCNCVTGNKIAAYTVEFAAELE